MRIEIFRTIFYTVQLYLNRLQVSYVNYRQIHLGCLVAVTSGQAYATIGSLLCNKLWLHRPLSSVIASHITRCCSSEAMAISLGP
jgi:hypothetical protein